MTRRVLHLIGIVSATVSLSACDCADGGPRCVGDSAAEGCTCDADDTTACYSGSAETLGVGACRGGTRSCRDGAWGPCEGEVLPQEIDRGMDDDCDGVIEDECPAPDACGDACCGPEEHCLGVRCAPPAPCDGRDDCDDDTHCVDGFCIPWEDGGMDPECRDEGGGSRSFTPTEEWSWSTGNVVFVQPIVVDLDGEADPEPEVVFSAMRTRFLDDASFVVALDGATGEERWRTEAPWIDALSPIAAGDVTGDHRVEVAAKSRTDPSDEHDALVLFDADGSVLCESDRILSPASYVSVAIANLDGVGDAEILVGLHAFDSSCHQIWNGSACADEVTGFGILDCGLFLDVPAIADVDSDGDLEVVSGNRIFDGASGEVELALELDDGPVAIADFDRTTPEPEIVVATPSGVRIQTIDGDVVFEPNLAVALDVSRFGPGAPMVADLDGDGEVEAAITSSSLLVVFDPDCEEGWARGGACAGGADGVLWQRGIQDFSSGMTGSTVFDFDGDGALELLAADQCFLHVWDAATGAPRFAIPNTNGTSLESPIVADADGDGSAEILLGGSGWHVPCAEDPDTGEDYEMTLTGVRVFGGGDDAWMPTRRVWNQHAYSVTNVDEDGAIPAPPTPSWSAPGPNTFLVNPVLGATVRAIDATVRSAAYEASCPERIRLHAVVANRGTGDARAGIAVSFHGGAPAEAGGVLLCETETTRVLGPGETEDVSCDWLVPGARVDVWIRVDADGALRECGEENDDAHLDAVGCGGVE